MTAPCYLPWPRPAAKTLPHPTPALCRCCGGRDPPAVRPCCRAAAAPGWGAAAVAVAITAPTPALCRCCGGRDHRPHPRSVPLLWRSRSARCAAVRPCGGGAGVGCRCCGGRDHRPHPRSVPLLWRSRSPPPPPLCAAADRDRRAAAAPCD
jgi:hypothetical protein